MIPRIALVLFYVLFVGHGAPIGSLVLEHLVEHRELSETCSDHSCMCTLKGFCGIDCCCEAGGTKITVDGPALASCGSSNPELDQTKLHQPHLVPLTLEIPPPPLESVCQGTHAQAWKDWCPLGPQKIPIFFI